MTMYQKAEYSYIDRTEKEDRYMKKILGILLILSMLFAVSAASAAGTGEPYGDSDGVISREKLAGLYRWLTTIEKSFRMRLTFDDVGNAVGKAGHDRGDPSEKYHAADWTDEEGRYHVVVTFYYDKDRDAWWPGSITTGMSGEEYMAADLTQFPLIGNREAGSSPTEKVTVVTKISSTGQKFAVTADLPTENWYPEESFGKVSYFLHAEEKDYRYSYSYIQISFLPSMDRWREEIAKTEEFTEIGGIACGELSLGGCTYKQSGRELTEYYAEIPELEAVVRVIVREIDLLPGTEAAAILESLSFASAE